METCRVYVFHDAREDLSEEEEDSFVGEEDDYSSDSSFKSALYADVEFRNGVKPYQMLSRKEQQSQLVCSS